MNNSKELCLFLDETSSEISNAEKATAIAVSIISIITSLTATTGNALILFVFYKFQRLRTLQNLLITSLCITDILTGAIVQPLFAIRRLHSVHNDTSICTIRLTYIFFANLCTGASLLSVGFVTVDRCIAITQPYRYVSSINAKIYAVMLVSFWLAWGAFTLMPFLGVMTTFQYFIGISVTFMTIICIVIVSYGLIYHVVRVQRKKIAVIPSFKYSSPNTQISIGNRNIERNNVENRVLSSLESTRPHQHIQVRESSIVNGAGGRNIQPKTRPVFLVTKVQATGVKLRDIASKTDSEPTTTTDRRNRGQLIKRFISFSKEKRRANTIAIVITTLLACYMPQIVLLNIRAVQGDNEDLLLADAWADLFVYINSTLNPLIYCFRNKDVKTALKSVMRNIFVCA